VREGVEEVGDDVVGPLGDLAVAIAADGVAVSAEPEVAFAVDVGLVRTAALTTVDLDHHALRAPRCRG
jgi:hypothetical protein